MGLILRGVLKRNYELLVRKVVGGESRRQILIDARISSRVGPKGRTGQATKAPFGLCRYAGNQSVPPPCAWGLESDFPAK